MKQSSQCSLPDNELILCAEMTFWSLLGVMEKVTFALSLAATLPLLTEWGGGGGASHEMLPLPTGWGGGSPSQGTPWLFISSFAPNLYSLSQRGSLTTQRHNYFSNPDLSARSPPCSPISHYVSFLGEMGYFIFYSRNHTLTLCNMFHIWDHLLFPSHRAVLKGKTNHLHAKLFAVNSTNIMHLKAIIHWSEVFFLIFKGSLMEKQWYSQEHDKPTSQKTGNKLHSQKYW